MPPESPSRSILPPASPILASLRHPDGVIVDIGTHVLAMMRETLVQAGADESLALELLLAKDRLGNGILPGDFTTAEGQALLRGQIGGIPCVLQLNKYAGPAGGQKGINIVLKDGRVIAVDRRGTKETLTVNGEPELDMSGPLYDRCLGEVIFAGKTLFEQAPEVIPALTRRRIQEVRALLTPATNATWRALKTQNPPDGGFSLRLDIRLCSAPAALCCPKGSECRGLYPCGFCPADRQFCRSHHSRAFFLICHTRSYSAAGRWYKYPPPASRPAPGSRHNRRRAPDNRGNIFPATTAKLMAQYATGHRAQGRTQNTVLILNRFTVRHGHVSALLTRRFYRFLDWRR
ncbi:Uncharacterised protein [Cedecea neteri]|uniref:Uncharacterized protein n=1 Tax=Cedecea neteri TaxID=158822 RepID=A0A2X3JDL1_9ENTR|nr:Uncharacterised protein [Cedecea neteri]